MPPAGSIKTLIAIICNILAIKEGPIKTPRIVTKFSPKNFQNLKI